MTPNSKNVLYMLKESNAIEGVYGRLALINAHRAWKFLIKHNDVTPQIIKDTHKILMRGQPMEKKYFGEWRDVPVYIGGEKKSQPPLVINNQIKHWCWRTNTINRNFDAVSLHISFENIHPFIDGNGRIGRILLNWHQVKKNKAPLIVYTVKDVKTYYRLFRSYREQELKLMNEVLSKDWAKGL